MGEGSDPRVFFAAERTLLAWNRTSLALMAFGFVIERFGLFLHLVAPQRGSQLEHGVSFWVGIAFVLLGAWTAAISILQYRKVLCSLKPIEIPDGYRTQSGVLVNVAVALLGLALTVYLFLTP